MSQLNALGITIVSVLLLAGFLGACAPEEAPALEVNAAVDEEALEGPTPVPDMGQPYDPTFAAWNQLLRESVPGRDVALLNLDALTHNVDTVRQVLPADGPFALRIVTKSLPSVELIQFIMATASTDRLMVFSESMLKQLLLRCPYADMILGRPMPAAVAGEILRNPIFAWLALHVRWLVDTTERVEAYAAMAEALGLTLNLAIEIDVGLRRGGALDTAELSAMLDAIATSGNLRLAGLMGYDGHVPAATLIDPSTIPPGVPLPDPFPPTMEQEFASVHARYNEFAAVAVAWADAHPSLTFEPLVFNSGGTRTYPFYSEAFGNTGLTSVNDIAMGSGFVSPAAFPELALFGHRAASYLASPVLKKIDPARVPFAFDALPFIATYMDPNLGQAFFMVGGGFPGVVVSPGGLQRNPFMGGSDGGIRSLNSNQDLLNGSPSVGLDVGDFIFYQPFEGDGLVWRRRIHLVQSYGADDWRLVGRWWSVRERG